MFSSLPTVRRWLLPAPSQDLLKELVRNPFQVVSRDKLRYAVAVGRHEGERAQGRQTVVARGFFPANGVIFTKCRDERTTRTQKNSVSSMS
jgi:hypothetical protein